MTWYWISLHYATFGLGCRDGRVVETAPIAMWAMGRDEDWVLGYYYRKGAQFAQLAL